MRRRKSKRYYEDGSRNLRYLLKIVDKEQMKKLVPLDDIHSLTSITLASESQDKIFAALGLTYERPLLIPEPDCQRPLDDILRDLTIRRLF